MHLMFHAHAQSSISNVFFDSVSGLVPKRELHAPPSCQNKPVAPLSVNSSWQLSVKHEICGNAQNLYTLPVIE